MRKDGLFVFTIKVTIAAVIFSGMTIFTVVGCRDLLIDGFSGGPDFWASVEKGLYRFADRPDMAPEKKAKIIAALRRVGERNRPYVDALMGKQEEASR